MYSPHIITDSLEPFSFRVNFWSDQCDNGCYCAVNIYTDANNNGVIKMRTLQKIHTEDVIYEFAVPCSKWQIFLWLITGGKKGRLFKQHQQECRKYFTPPERFNCRCSQAEFKRNYSQSWTPPKEQANEKSPAVVYREFDKHCGSLISQGLAPTKDQGKC
jgi:hypothetical protein